MNMYELMFFIEVHQKNINLYELIKDFYFPNNYEYNTEIPTPESIIGHQIGELHISHDKLVQYMQILARKSDRIKIENRGLTFESRPLILLTITSKENHKKIDQIRQNHIKATNEDYDYDLKKRPPFWDIIPYFGLLITLSSAYKGVRH